MSEELKKLELMPESVPMGSAIMICYNYIKDNYDFQYNVITGQIEDHKKTINGQYVELDDRELN